MIKSTDLEFWEKKFTLRLDQRKFKYNFFEEGARTDL
jgi:hypothetical protein